MSNPNIDENDRSREAIYIDNFCEEIEETLKDSMKIVMEDIIPTYPDDDDNDNQELLAETQRFVIEASIQKLVSCYFYFLLYWVFLILFLVFFSFLFSLSMVLKNMLYNTSFFYSF